MFGMCRTNLLHCYGKFVGTHPWPFLLAPLCLTIVLSFGILRTQTEDNLNYLYSPQNAPSHSEYRVHRNFYGVSSNASTYVSVALTCDGDLLSEHNLYFLISLLEYIEYNLTLTWADHAKKYHYGSEVCPSIPLCKETNTPAKEFLKAAQYLRSRNRSDSNFSKIRLTYPSMYYFGSHIFLGNQVYGAEKDPKTGKILSVKVLHLAFAIYEEIQPIKAFEQALDHFLLEKPKELRYAIFSDQILQAELNSNLTVALPYMLITALLLTVFTFVSTLTGDVITSKSTEALLGLASTSLATVSAFGFLFFIGVPFTTQIMMMPFLALAIGIDDTFIMVGAWQKTTQKLRPQHRLARTLAEAGASITVTSLTDGLAFFVGSFCQTPAVSIFCISMTAAIFFDYLYQVTFFASVLAFGGRREEQKRHFILLTPQHGGVMPAVTDSCEIAACSSCSCNSSTSPRKTLCVHKNGLNTKAQSSGNISRMTLATTTKVNLIARYIKMNTIQGKSTKRYQNSTSVPANSIATMPSRHSTFESSDGHIMQRIFSKRLAPALCHKYSRIAVLVVYGLYLILSLYGCSRMKTDFSPTKLITDNNVPLQLYGRLTEQFFWTEAFPVHVYANNIPDLNNRSNIIELLDIATVLERSEYSLGREATQYWLRDFELYNNEYGGADYEFDFYEIFSEFIRFPDSSKWQSVIAFGANDSKIDRFFFTTAFRVDSFTDRTHLAAEWRSIASRYSSFDVVIYDDQRFFTDEIAALSCTMQRAVGIVLIAMILVCCVFITDRTVVFWVVFTLLSMDIGIIGFLSLWGASLSPTTIMNALMSCGLSVDFSAHIGYRYYKDHSFSKDKSIEKRIGNALGAVGWPVTQGGLSTLLAIFALQFVPSAVVRIFFKTTFLVVWIGLFHGLCVLPVLLRTITREAS